jgi:hypothetical protein
VAVQEIGDPATSGNRASPCCAIPQNSLLTGKITANFLNQRLAISKREQIASTNAELLEAKSFDSQDAGDVFLFLKTLENAPYAKMS